MLPVLSGFAATIQSAPHIEYAAEKPRIMERTPSNSRSFDRAALLLFLLLTALSARVLIVNHDIISGEKSFLLYQAATLAFNYFDFGFIRRGLAGSLVYLLGPDRLQSTALFHLLTAASVAAVACWFFARLELPLPHRIVFALPMIA